MDNSVNPALTQKEILRITEEELERGKSKQQVLDDLSQRQHHHSPEYLAQIISTVPDLELRRKYRVFNHVFFGLLVVTAGLHIVGSIAILFFLRCMPDMCSTTFFSLFILLMAADVWRMRAYAYMGVAAMSLVAMLPFATISKGLYPCNLLSFTMFGTTIILSIHLRGCLFPHHGFMGIKKDRDGNWML